MDLMARAHSGAPLRALGLMSGTSLDGVDVALIETDGERIHGHGPSLTVPYSEEVRASVRGVFGAETTSAATERADRLVTQAHRDAIAAFFAEHAGHPQSAIDVVGFHGQTITHRPERRFTWQLGAAAWLARELGLPVVHDFRSADVSAGGQGAPLVPVYHQALVARAVGTGRLRLPVAVLNIGGVANVTWIGPDGALLAFDTGPGNAPLDDWTRQHTGRRFDEGGRLAATGQADTQRIGHWLTSSYFSRNPPKSLDRNDFTADLAAGLSPADGAATLAFACAAAAAAAIAHMPTPPSAWIVCGGGAKNHIILKYLQYISNISIEQEVWPEADAALEAHAFGYLAVRSLRRLPLSFPGTTGVAAAMSGGRLAWG